MDEAMLGKDPRASRAGREFFPCMGRSIFRPCKALINQKAIPEQDGLQLLRVGTVKRLFQIFTHKVQESESSQTCQTAQ